MWKCPRCGEDLHDYDAQCWNCRTKNPSAPAGMAAPSPLPQLPQRMKRCPYCAEEIREEAIKCRYCGMAMPGFERREVASAPDSGKAAADTGARDYIRIPKRLVWWGIGLVLGAAVLAVVAIASIPLVRMAMGQSKDGPARPPAKAEAAKKGAYEEVIEYDARGNIKKATKNYE